MPTLAELRDGDGYVKRVCKIGQGASCCRYLTMGPQGWDCEKHTQLGRYLDGRVKREELVARGDNCEGVLREKESQMPTDEERLEQARDLFRSAFDLMIRTADEGPAGLQMGRQRTAEWAQIIIALEALVRRSD
jgi:hypothetical protein